MAGEVVALNGQRRGSTGDASAGEEPCYRCECCTRWAGALETLRAAIASHNALTPRGYPCTDGCLVCEVAAWSR